MRSCNESLKSGRFVRREFLAVGAALAATGLTGRPPKAAEPAGATDRSYWLDMLRRVASPVLTHLAENRLKLRMPIEAPANQLENRRQVTHLEALGRTLTGIAPWLELAPQEGPEGALANQMSGLAQRAIENATNPNAADYLNFTTGGQPLVDAAFLAHALVRAPRSLWSSLSPETQTRVHAALRQTRGIKPGKNNWLLFSAMVETALATTGADWREDPIATAVDAHEEWYQGDGTYGDGPELHWDYYNSFVIQPMLLDVLENIGRFSQRWQALLPRIKTRARRYAAIQERLIGPDGTYPPIGRSMAYRCGAFQLLAQMALRRELPERVSPGQVRSALTAVIRQTLGAEETFDAEGWLRVGVHGHQPGLAESYISTGSLYLCSAVFLPLGLPASDPFWSAPPADWTQRKLWMGQDLPADHALANEK